MRPLRLALEGFTSYRRRVEIDFSDLQLFAITGPTGAGKSSLVDALAYCLYGQAPRVGNSVRELISQGGYNGRLSVSLEFETGGRRYRIVRSTSVQGKPFVQLEELDERTGRWSSLEDKAAAATERVRELLGMDYDGFVRSVVLPQGQFQQFLVGRPEERRKVLDELLRLDIYAQMVSRANMIASRRQEEAEALALRLRQELAEATPERLHQLKAEWLAIKQRQAATALQVQTLERAAEEARRLRDAQARRQEAQARLAELQQRARIARETVERTRAEIQGAEDALRQVQQAIQGVAYDPVRHGRLRPALQMARQVQRLDVQIEELEEQERRYASELAEVERRAQEAQRREDEHLALCRQAEEVRDGAQQALAAARARQAQAEGLLPSLRQARARLTEAMQLLATEEEALGRAREHLERARAIAQEAAREAQRAREELERARRQASALELRRHLHPGDDCPVCGRRVTGPLPAVEALPQLAAAEEAAREAEAAAQRAQEALRQAETAEAQARQSVELHLQSIQRHQEDRERLERALADLFGQQVSPEEAEAALREETRKAAEGLRQAEASLAQAREALRLAQEARAQAQREEASLRQRQEGVRQRLQQAREQRERLHQDLAQEAGPAMDVAALEGELGRLEEARRRLEALQREKETLEERRGRLVQGLMEADKELAALGAEESAASRQMDEAEAVIGQVAPGLRRRAQEQRWPEVLAALDEGRDPSPPVLDLLRERQREADDLARASGVLEARLQQLEKDIETAERLRQQEAEARREAEVARQLAQLLQSNNFQSYLRQEALHILAEDGSRHLNHLSRGQYDFTVQEDRFYIVDHWNGDAIRPAHLLSGGETFLASLSLALALAERLPELAHARGPAALESLFIDEGFSHLDDDTLDIVANALEALGTNGRRMVGIITHIAALAERMPVRLRVEKTPEGSTVVKE